MQCFGALPWDWFSCGDGCCDPVAACVDGVCVTTGDCDDDDDCTDDTYCDTDRGHCIPYGTGARGDFNPACERTLTVARFGPELQCQWAGPPAGDPNPAWQHILSTPLVADFDFDGDRCQWIDDKEGRELFDRISEVVSQKLGRSVRI